MGNLRDPRSCGALIGLLSDGELLVRLRALEALLTITGQRRGYDARAKESERKRAVVAWDAWHKKNADKLGSLGPAEPKAVLATWNGPKPEPEPEPAPKPEVEPVPQPQPSPQPEPVPQPEPPVKPVGKNDVTAEAVAFYNAGIARLDAGDEEAAFAALSACVKLRPDWKDAHFNLALACKRLGKYDEAITHYERCLALGGEDVATLNNLGNVHERKGDVAAAEGCYRRALKASPGNAVSRYNLAELVFAKNEWAEAIPLYERLLAAEIPEALDASVVRLRLSACLLKAGNEAAGLKLLEEAVARTRNPAVLREAGRVYFERRRFDRSKRLFEEAYKAGLDAESAYALALFLLRVPDEKLKNADLAAFYVEQALTAQPKDVCYLAALAQVHSARGDRANAIAVLEKALELAPDSPALTRQLREYRGP
jgi:tetratricopeptide (TPR) repeat protein